MRDPDDTIDRECAGFDDGGGAPPPEDWELLVRSVESKARALGSTPEFWAEIAQRAFISTAKGGDVIVPESATPNFFSTVVEGAVAITVHDERRRRSIVQIAKPGFIFSLTPFAERGERRRFAAVAFTDAKVASVDRQTVEDVLRRVGRESHLGLLAYMCRALSRIIYDRCRLYRLEVVDRVLQQLVELARHFGDTDDPGRIDLPLQHEDLADLCGTRRSTVSKKLSVLEAGGYVSRVGGRYRVAPAVLRKRSLRIPLVSEGVDVPVADEPGARDTVRAVLRAAWKPLGAPADAVGAFCERATLHRYGAGETIGAGAHPAVTLLVEGTARVECVIPGADPVGVRIAAPGQFVGVGWSVDGPDRQRQFRAVALVEVLVARLDVRHMKRVVAALDERQMMLLLGLYSNLLSRQIYDRCVMLPMAVARRVDYVLRTLADEFPRPHASGTSIDLRQTEEDIAVLVAAERESVCKTIAPRKRSGEITVEDGHFVLHGRRTPKPAAP